MGIPKAEKAAERLLHKLKGVTIDREKLIGYRKIVSKVTITEGLIHSKGSANTWREGPPGMWRPGRAHRWHSTQGDGTTARGSFPTFGIQSHTDACTQVGAGGR